MPDAECVLRRLTRALASGPVLGRLVLAVLAVLVLAVLVAPGRGDAAAAPADAPPSLVTHVPVANGCFVVAPWLAGVKVFLVQRALGLRGHRDRYDAATQTAVRRFQAHHGLRQTGRVDRRTWRALDTGHRFCIDRYTAQPSLPLTATAAQRRQSLLDFARAQVGRRYIWGGAGPIGYDCSGLALQSMHAAGLSIPAITTADHQHSAFPSGQVLLDTAGLPHARFSHRRPGDLVFWTLAGTHTVEHVAIYVGHGQVIEAVRPRVRLGSVSGHTDLNRVSRVVRPFRG
jgi:cell wall-associated NlpC family hydrolase